MSTIEKAFLKSMKDEEKSESSSNQLDLPPTIEKKSDVNKLGSSRESIQHLQQPKPYSKLELEERRLIYTGMSNKKVLNNYRNLRTRLLAQRQKDNFIVLVTSVKPIESASYISANIAAAFALDESKTAMLIEANITNSILNSVFDLEHQKGLLDYLEDENVDSEEILHKTRVPRMSMISTGNIRENATEYFTSDKMQRFMTELVSRYSDRFLIVNAPSILESADTRILLNFCDTALLVVPYGECSEEDILKASVAIGKDKLAGLVLSDF